MTVVWIYFLCSNNTGSDNASRNTEFMETKKRAIHYSLNILMLLWQEVDWTLLLFSDFDSCKTVTKRDKESSSRRRGST
jgi:hypothetical protein